MHPDRLERLVDRSLQALPLPQAPRTLLPRVMAAVAACERRPWYTRAWLSWPRVWQAASAAALLALVVGSAFVLPSVRSAAAAMLATPPGVTVGQAAAALDGTLRVLDATGGAIRAFWRVVFAPLVAYAALLVALMSLVCAALGTTVAHLAAGKAVSR